MRPPSLDIRTKLTGMAFTLVGVVVCALTLYLSSRQSATLELRMEGKAVTYAHLLARESESAIAFDDAETAREIFAAAAVEPELHAVALYKSDGTMLGGLGEHRIEPAETAEPLVRRAPSIIGVVIPVVSKEGPRGILVLELSTAAIERESQAGRRGAIGAGAVALALGLVASWFIGGSFSKRLRRIQRATQAFAKGRLNERAIEDGSRDEIGDLGRAFNTMAQRTHDLIECIEVDGREETARLDRVVADRTRELQKKNQDLAIFLQHVDQGFMTVDEDGSLAPERSRILADWLGEAPPDGKLWDWIAARDPRIGRWLAISWEAVFDGMLPPELALDQLPKEIRAGARTLGIRYQPINDEAGVPAKIIVVVSDISAEIARHRAEETQKEIARVCARIVADPRSVEVFLAEGGAIVDSLRGAADAGASLNDQQRWLHTLKGNSSFIGLGRVAELCHVMENHVVEMTTPPPPSTIASLVALWEEFRSTVRPLLSHTRRDEVAVRRTELVEHLEGIRSGRNRAALAAQAAGWLLEPASERLERAAEQARVVARRLEKANVEITVEGNDVRLDPQAWSEFWAAFVHVVRNAVDHGIEDEETRASANKPLNGTIVLRAFATPTEDVIEIADDGAGIDWAALRERARAVGLDAAMGFDVLFADGVSTKAEVTETSGRGVGLGASRAATEAMGGRVEVTSALGAGTTFSFRIPRRDVEAPLIAA